MSNKNKSSKDIILDEVENQTTVDSTATINNYFKENSNVSLANAGIATTSQFTSVKILSIIAIFVYFIAPVILLIGLYHSTEFSYYKYQLDIENYLSMIFIFVFAILMMFLNLSGISLTRKRQSSNVNKHTVIRHIINSIFPALLGAYWYITPIDSLDTIKSVVMISSMIVAGQGVCLFLYSFILSFLDRRKNYYLYKLNLYHWSIALIYHILVISIYILTLSKNSLDFLSIVILSGVAVSTTLLHIFSIIITRKFRQELLFLWNISYQTFIINVSIIMLSGFILGLGMSLYKNILQNIPWSVWGTFGFGFILLIFRFVTQILDNKSSFKSKIPPIMNELWLSIFSVAILGAGGVIHFVISKSLPIFSILLPFSILLLFFIIINISFNQTYQTQHHVKLVVFGLVFSSLLTSLILIVMIVLPAGSIYRIMFLDKIGLIYFSLMLITMVIFAIFALLFISRVQNVERIKRF